MMSRVEVCCKKRWLVYGVIWCFFLQACTSVSYVVQQEEKRDLERSILMEGTFSADLRGYGVLWEDESGIHDGILDGLKQAGLKPSGPMGSDYNLTVILEEGKMQKTAASSFQRLTTAIIAGVTLLIVPYAVPYDFNAIVGVEELQTRKKVAQFKVPMSATVCTAFTPLAYLCAPNAGSAGRSLGEEIASRLRSIRVTPAK